MTGEGTAMTARVSAVIPLFNKANCVRRAVRSILEQTAPCDEIIVVDDGSTDDGYRVVEGIEDDRIKLFHQENQGCSAARNRGIEEAHGDLIAFLDADDEWKPWFLDIVLGLWAKHPDAGAYATVYEIQEAYGRVYVPSYRAIPPAPWEGVLPNYFRSSLWHNPVRTSAVAIRREVFQKVGRFVLCPGLGQDAELWGRIALRFPIAFSWRVGAVYHREAEHRRCETVFTHVFASDSFERTLRSQEVSPHLLPDVQEFLAKEKLAAASRYVLGGQPRIARDILQHCRTRRFLRRKLWWSFWAMLPTKCVSLAWRSKRWFRSNLQSWSRRYRRYP
jgi:glycosyltransferase involved in cell wall biosynthesis